MMIQDDAKKILQFINVVGGITKKQIDVLLPEHDEKTKMYFISSLKAQYIKETSYGSGVYVKRNSQLPFLKKNELAGWVLLDNDVDMDAESNSYYKAKAPAQIFFLCDGIIYTVVYVDENGLPIMKMIREMYHNEQHDKDDDGQYIFVTDSEAARKMVMDADLDIPYCGAFVYKNNDGNTEIEYDFFE